LALIKSSDSSAPTPANS